MHIIANFHKIEIVKTVLQFLLSWFFFLFLGRGNNNCSLMIRYDSTKMLLQNYHADNFYFIETILKPQTL